MWTRGWRETIWSGLDQYWDLIVIGGGITGAAILREASRVGIKTLLVEARDFASGTSSRSSKLVHGGLRYLRHLQINLTRESVRERERLLRQGSGLVEPLENVIVSYAGDRTPGWAMSAALAVYDALALQWRHKHWTPSQIRELCPYINPEGLEGGHSYFDAWTDDARLVLRVIREAVRSGGTALNYAPVQGLLRDGRGQVRGIQLRDEESGKTTELHAAVVIAAAGAWADELRSHIGAGRRLRPLRGSHFFFSRERLPLTRSISFMHPADQRPVFAFPWEGVTIVGTTDVDQGFEIPADPRPSEAEIGYLMEAVTHAFQPLGLREEDVRSTISGVRPVVDTGQKNPSKESREFVLWTENDLLTVTGGKLTTFRPMAQQALAKVRSRLPRSPRIDRNKPALDPLNTALPHKVPERIASRLAGRYGVEAAPLMDAARASELEPIGDSPTLWAELRWSARAEGVVHLDDLLLRRVRLGLVAPCGALPIMERIREIVQPELGWDDERWHAEADAYSQLWKHSYSLTQHS